MHSGSDNEDGKVCHAMIWAPAYPPHGFSDHGPMAAFALRRLGADEATRRRFERRYTRRLAPPDPQSAIAITKDNFSRYLGRGKAYLGFFRHFLDRIGEGESVPGMDMMLPGLSTAAFHALIRIAYGLEAGDRTEVAAGLAYLADEYRPLADDGVMADKRMSYRDLYGELIEGEAVHALRFPALKGDIHQKMRQVAADPSGCSWVARARGAAELSLEEIASCNLDFFLRTGDFTALHMVTAAHAARVVAPHVKQRDRFLARMAEASTAALLTVPPAAIGDLSGQEDPPEAGEIAALARQSHDEHDIKLAYSCISEYEHYGWAAYLSAARLRLKRRQRHA